MKKLKIALVSLQQESNTLSPVETRREDFALAVGKEMMEHIHIGDLLKEANAVAYPTLFAHALPGGAVRREDFLNFVDEIINGIPQDIDGVWLFLHGAMYVTEIGSGETYLLQEIRKKIGFKIPISVGLDFHANNTDEICQLSNVICGFRTVPHTDQIETERRALTLLLTCIEKQILPRPRISRSFVVAPGDAVQSSLHPLKSIMLTAQRIELQEGILCAQVFGGQSWVDVPYMGPSMIVTHESNELVAQKYADELAMLFYDHRYDFRFLIEAVDAVESVKLAINDPEQVFITDSGDNTTAGATGDNAYLLRLLLEAGAERTLVSGIVDKNACECCMNARIGDILNLKIGGSLFSGSECIDLSCELIRYGEILGYTGMTAGKAATLKCNGVTIVITEQRTAFTSMAIFHSAELDLSQYKIIVVKQGYLFPDLAKIGSRVILAMTPGSSTENLADMHHKQIHRPMYPLDDNFI